MYVQSRLAGDDWDGDSTSNKSAIEAIVSSGNFIGSNDDDFQVYFGSNETNLIIVTTGLLLIISLQKYLHVK